MMPTVYVREDPTNPGNPEIIIRPVLARWKFKTTDGLRYVKKDLQAVLLAHPGIGETVFRKILVAAMSVALDWIRSERAEVPEPDCLNCEAPFEEHAQDKCLYTPTMYAPRGMEIDPPDEVFGRELRSLFKQRF